MRIENELKLDYSDVLLKPKRSTLGSRKDVNLNRVFANFDWNGIPIMASNMDGVGTFEMAKTLSEFKMFTTLRKTYDTSQLIEFFSNKDNCQHTAMSIGITDYDYRKFLDVYSMCKYLQYVCIDVANGYSERFVEFVIKIKEIFKEGKIIAGNVVTGEMTEQLILSGVDVVKVGIGPGAVCTTRIQTGVGYPQLSAVIECADAAHGLGGLVIADGGCTCPGDVVKAFAGGADFVMLGGMLAGHDEGGGEIIEKHYVTNQIEYTSEDYPQSYELIRETKKFVEFYGMSSKKANDNHFGGLKEYRASEGREIIIEYRGSVKNTVNEILGGLRSACTYVGASKLKDLSKCATFIRTNNQYNKIFEK